MLLKKLKNNLTKTLLILGSVLFFVNDLGAREIEEVFQSMSSIKNPLSARDPFQPPKIERSLRKDSNTPVRDGVFTNVPVINNVNLDELEIIGVIIGPDRRAFVRKNDNDKTVYTIKEGMKLGANSAEIRAILPGGIILVERVTNIYGEDEFLETVIPLSK